ncbi:MAG TPA: FUSC family protein [Steroidobacteraceae bacterium]|jgi:MFS family permease|nr:FUSC family protein [Steroidobacteraceae bacterium]
MKSLWMRARSVPAVLWPPEQAQRALLCLPAMALLLGAGLAAGDPRAALAAASGALSCGFGSFFYDTTRHRATPMALAGIGMALSAAVGSLVGHSTALFLVTAVLWSLLCAWLIAFGTGAWWIVLQWAVGLFVSSAYSTDFAGAAQRGALILVGTAVQLAIIVGFWRLGILAPPARIEGVGPAGYLSMARQKLRAGENHWSYVFAAGAAVALAVLIERALTLPNGYWAPMTALIVMRPDLAQTWSRVTQRILGTLIGAGLATLAAAALRPSPGWVAALIVLFAWSAYGSRTTNYGVFTASITGAVVFLLSLAGTPEPLNALHRLLATALGALLAIGVRQLIRALRRAGYRPRPPAAPHRPPPYG